MCAVFLSLLDQEALFGRTFHRTDNLTLCTLGKHGFLLLLNGQYFFIIIFFGFCASKIHQSTVDIEENNEVVRYLAYKVEGILVLF